MSASQFLVLVRNRAHGPLSPAVIDTARDMVSGRTPTTLSPGEAVEIPCPATPPGAPGPDAIRAAFATEGVDALLVPGRGRRKAVLIADMDSTIVLGETLDELAESFGVGEEVTAITRASMNGELDFTQSLRARVALLAGCPETRLAEVWAQTRLRDGAIELVRTMRAHGASTALVSGGFTWFTGRVAEACGFEEHHGNKLGIRDGQLTGEVEGDIVGPEAKFDHLTRLAETRGARLRATLAVGDGANDLPMLSAAGLGVAMAAKPVVRRAIPTQVNLSDLRALLFAQGYPATSFIT